MTKKRFKIEVCIKRQEVKRIWSDGLAKDSHLLCRSLFRPTTNTTIVLFGYTAHVVKNNYFILLVSCCSYVWSISHSHLFFSRKNCFKSTSLTSDIFDFSIVLSEQVKEGKRERERERDKWLNKNLIILIWHKSIHDTEMKS